MIYWNLMWLEWKSETFAWECTGIEIFNIRIAYRKDPTHWIRFTEGQNMIVSRLPIPKCFKQKYRLIQQENGLWQCLKLPNMTLIGVFN